VTPNSQAVKDVAASHEALIHLFERIHLFLQRLNRYTGMPLTGDMTVLLGKIMSQVLSILALSTKEMMNRRISELDCPVCRSSMTNYGAEKILKKLAGRTDVEDAVLQLDTLTKEESLMAVVRNLEVTHRMDGNVEATKVLTEDIDDNVKATKALTENVGDNINATRALTEDIGDNVNAAKALAEDIGDNVKVIDHDLKTTKDSTQPDLTVFVHADFPLYANIVTDEVKRSSFPALPSLKIKANIRLQETS